MTTLTRPARYKKTAIPKAAKVAVALREGCTPGTTTRIHCNYCPSIGELWWPLTYTGKVGGHMVATGFELDHVFPESKGGSSEPDNLTFACMPCNRAKKDKVPN